MVGWVAGWVGWSLKLMAGEGLVKLMVDVDSLCLTNIQWLMMVEGGEGLLMLAAALVNDDGWIIIVSSVEVSSFFEVHCGTSFIAPHLQINLRLLGVALNA